MDLYIFPSLWFAMCKFYNKTHKSCSKIAHSKTTFIKGCAPVRDGNLVEVGVFPVEEVGVGPPDLGEELPVHGQLLHVRPVVLQPSVHPELPETDRVHLWIHGCFLHFWIVPRTF